MIVYSEVKSTPDDNRHTYQTRNMKMMRKIKLNSNASEGQLVESCQYYGSAGKSLALPERKQATATEYFEFHISCL